MEMGALCGEPLNETEKVLVRQGSYINAIKSYNDRTHVGLRPSKAAVEAFGKEDGLRGGGPCPYCDGTGHATVWLPRKG